MMHCDRAKELFGGAWDDELSVAERESVEGHLASCVSCHREYDDLARLLELVQTLPRPTVPSDFAEQVLLEARRRETAHPARRGFWARFAGDRTGRPLFPWAGRPAFALAATLLVVGGGVAFYLAGPIHDGPQARSVAGGHVVASAPATPERLARPAAGAVSPRPSASAHRLRADHASGAGLASKHPAAVPGGHAGLPGGALASGANAADAPSVPDSLFDHSADVEFVLDPVTLKRERGRGYTPVQSPVRGEAASITF